jgi:D-alanyl-D-alanine carboxypeptidase/D-alanyl-D-alanine-endopeptidase (penicillin-binding protein 4)
LATRIEKVTCDPRFKQAHWGILAVDLKSGNTVYEHDADKMFAPASTTKLYSTAAVLDALGADYRFKTPVYARGKVDDAGRLDGDLVLVASGDLSMGGRTDAQGRIAFANSDHIYAQFNSTAELTAPDPLAGLNELAKQVAASGIKAVGGDVLVDDRLFDHAESTGSGPRQITPIIVNDNLVDVTIEPTTAGTAARVRWRPESAAVRVDAQVTTVAGNPTKVSVDVQSDGAIVVRGRIAASRKTMVRTCEVDDPASFARTLFVEALGRAAVRVEASALTKNRVDRLPDAGAYATLAKKAELISPPLADSVRLVLKVSHNLHASTFPLLVAAKNGKRTLADGMKLQNEYFRRAGVDVGSISFGGGAGGSRSDYVTPRATVQLLRHISGRPDFAVYKDALPILGVDGTLSKAVPSTSPARGKVFAKTGTLLWDNAGNGGYILTSKALAGYMTTAGGRELALAIFVNNVPIKDSEGGAKLAGETLGKLCEILFDGGGGK